MKKAFVKWLVKWFVIRMNLYLLWSKLHQSLFQRSRMKLPAVKSIADVEAVLKLGTYRADPWWVLGDVIAHPEHTYCGFLNPKLAGAFGCDCDDFSVLAGVLFQQIPDQVKGVHILSVQYIKKTGKIGGHNVCVFWDIKEERWGYISNWFGGKAFGRYVGEKAIVAEVLEVVEAELLSWFVFSPDLKNGIGGYHIEKE